MSNYCQSLDEYRDDAVHVGEGFHCDSKEKAMWAARKLREVDEAINANDALADVEIEKIRNWLVMANTRLNKDVECFEGFLREYLESERAKDPSIKQVVLPDATPKFRKQQDKYTRNDDVILPFARVSAPQYVKMEESLQWGEFKKQLQQVDDGGVVLKSTGEVVPGVTFIKGCDEFIVDVVKQDAKVTE
jgi:hypothetical protein